MNYDPAANIDDGSCQYCYDNMFTLEMFDSFGDGWNGNNFTITTFAGNLAGLQRLLLVVLVLHSFVYQMVVTLSLVMVVLGNQKFLGYYMMLQETLF